MDRLIYTALSGMDAAMNRQRMTANNLANAQTPGFRAELFNIDPGVLKGPSLEARMVNRGFVHSADMTEGSVVYTGEPLDIAVKGAAFIAVQADDGSEVYTRRGDLAIDVSGALINGDGRPVMGANGPITVPGGATITIGADGTLLARDAGAPDAPLQEVGRIKLANAEGSQIAKGLDGFFRVVGGGVLPADPTAGVVTGSLEQSNVNTAQVLVDMIEAQRSFERRMKVMTTAGQIDEGGARLMSLNA